MNKNPADLQVSVDKEVFKIIENTNFIDRRQR